MARHLSPVISLVALCLAIPLVSLASVSVIHTFDGESHPGGLEYPSAGIGDFNGDSYADWAVYTDEYAVNVYFGGASPDTIPDLILREHSFSRGGPEQLAGACDFNGDGYGDIVVGSGARVYLYFGGTAADAQSDLVLNSPSSAGDVFLASAGDFNGDGFGDVIIGDISTAYVFLGGDPPDDDADVTIAKGMQVAGIGDVDGDGYDDIAVGSNPTNIYFGSSAPGGTADLSIPSTLVDRQYHHAIGGVGDFNGDGFDDVAIGNPAYDNPAGPGCCDGMVSVCYGGAVMDAVVDWVVHGPASSGYMGLSVAAAGDVNDDSVADLVVGLPYNDKDYVFYGAQAPDTIPDLILAEVPGEDHFGSVALGIGDANGDDIDDVLGGPGYYGNYARVYFGGAGVDSIPDMVFTDEIGHKLGYAVSEAGDLNGDTYPDWAIGAPFGLNQGNAYVYHGGAAGDMVKDLTMSRLNGFGGEIDPAGDVRNDGYDDLLVRYTWCGEYVYVYYGGAAMDSINDKKLSSQPNCSDNGTWNMAKAGDFNGDGYDDVLVGYSGMFLPLWTELYYGGATFNTKHDVVFQGQESTGGNLNGDTFADVVVAEPYPWDGNGKVRIFLGAASVDSFPDPSYVINGSSESFGARVAIAGDLNGDSYDDIIVSSSEDDYRDGDVYVYFGGPAMDVLPDIVLASPGVGSGFGAALEGLGDINGDSYDDVAVGSPWSAGYRGEVYIYFGGASMDADPDIILTGENPQDLFGFSMAGTGDINGDGDIEFLVGAPGFNDNRGVAYMYAASRAGAPDAVPSAGTLFITEAVPNPVRGHVTVRYNVGRTGLVRADLYDVSGRLMRALARENALPGDHVLEIDLAMQGRQPLAPGVYFVRMTQGDQSRAKKIVIAE